MYERTDKRRLYKLIEMYLSYKIDESTFCGDFIPSYDVELDHDSLTKKEHKAFYELSRITGRFSEFEKDHKDYPGTFYTKEEVKLKIIETKKSLKRYFEELEDKGELDGSDSIDQN